MLSELLYISTVVAHLSRLNMGWRTVAGLALNDSHNIRCQFKHQTTRYLRNLDSTTKALLIGRAHAGGWVYLNGETVIAMHTY